MPEVSDPHLDREPTDSFQRGGNPTPEELDALRNNYRAGEVHKLREQLDAIKAGQSGVDKRSENSPAAPIRKELDEIRARQKAAEVARVRNTIRRIEDTA